MPSDPLAFLFAFVSMARSSFIKLACASGVILAAFFVVWMTRTDPSESRASVAKPEARRAGQAQDHGPGFGVPQFSPPSPSGPPQAAELPYLTLEEFSGALATAISEKAPPGLIAKILNTSRTRLKPEDHVRLLGAAIEQLAAADPAAGAQVMRQLGDLHDQQVVAVGIAGQIAAKDPKAAAAWADSLGGHDMSRNAHEVVGREWARSDRQAVAAWINGTASPLLKGSIAQGLAQTWATEDMDGLIEWATTIPDSYVQTGVLVKAVKVLSATDPPAAAESALKFPAGMARRQALTYAAGQWGTAAPDAASQWAAQVTDPAARIEAISGVLRSWLNKAPKSANAWLATLPRSDQEAVNAIVYPSQAK